MTTVQDTLTYADGRLVNGQIVISWPVFQFDGVAVAGGMETYEIVDGAVQLSLYSNLNALPLGVYYTVVYELDEGARYEEYWIIPNLPQVNIGQIRVNFPTTPSVMISAQQLTSAGATPGQFLGWNGTHWVPMYVTMFNITPNTIALTLTKTVAADLSVSGSPAVLGAGLTLNIPDAGSTSRGVVTTAAQTFAGAKTFQAVATFSAGITVTGTSSIAGYVPATRLVSTGHGLSGGGSLAADLALAVVDDSTLQKIHVSQNSTLKGTRSNLNLIAGANVTLTVADNSGQNWVDVTITATGGGGGGATLPNGTATGDMLVWQEGVTPDPSFWTTLPVGAAGDVLTSDGTMVSWQAIPPQTPWQSNIDAAGYKLTDAGAIGIGQSSPAYPLDVVGDANITGVYRVNGVPLVTGVSSVFGRTGAVVAASGDYTASMVTHAVDSTATYADPAWITSLAWAKITGAPAFLVSPLTTKGDLMVYSTANVRLAVGTNGQVLTADSTQAGGIKWAAAIWQAGSGGAIYYNGGNVGIGTTAPTGSVHAARSDGAYQFVLERSGSVDPHIYGLAISGSAGNPTFLVNDVTAAQTRMSIATNGYVGIGTTSPVWLLDLVSPGQAGIAFGTTGGVATHQRARLVYDAGSAVTGGGFIFQSLTDAGVFGANLVTIVQGTGYVGIGTLNPSGLLHVASNTNSLMRLVFANSNTGTSARQDIAITATPGGTTSAVYVGADGNAYGQGEKGYMDVAAASPFLFQITTAGFMGGKIGIGTMGPYSLLTVTATAGVALNLSTVSTVFQVCGGSLGSSVNSQIILASFGASTTSQSSLGITAIREANGTDWQSVGFLLSHNVDNSAFINSSYIDFSYNGNFGFAKTSPGYRIDVNGDVNCSGAFRVNGVAIGAGAVNVQQNGGLVGSRSTLNFANGTSTLAQCGDDGANNRVNVSFSYSSDLRLKRNVVDLRGGLPVITQLRPVEFEWNGLAGFKPGQRAVAVVAQELQQVLPQNVYPVRTRIHPGVDDEEMDVLCYDPNEITFHLVLAVQELTRRLKVLEGKVN